MHTLRRPLVWGHRGADHTATDSAIVENTVEAFAAARAAGADGVELDVRCTADGVVVVFHDADLARLTGRTEAIASLSRAALQAIALPNGARIPTLDEVFAALGADMLINVEIKPPARPVHIQHRPRTRWLHRLPPGSWPRLQARLPPWALSQARVAVAGVRACIARHCASDRVLISSFHPAVVGLARWAMPQVPTGLLFHADQSLPLRRAWPAGLLHPTALHPEHCLVTEARVAAWHRRGYAVNAWTVDDAAQIRRLAALGVDGIISNQPGIALRALAAAS